MELGVVPRMICVPGPRRRRGFTLVELMVVIAIAGIAMAIVVPRFVRFVRYLNARSGVSQVVADLTLARTQAVREGKTVSFTVLDGTRYRVQVDSTTPRVIKTVDVKGNQRNISLGMPVGTRIAFDSRGMLRTGSANRMVVSYGSRADTVSVTGVGRVYRGN